MHGLGRPPSDIANVASLQKYFVDEEKEGRKFPKPDEGYGSCLKTKACCITCFGRKNTMMTRLIDGLTASLYAECQMCPGGDFDRKYFNEKMDKLGPDMETFADEFVESNDVQVPCEDGSTILGRFYVPIASKSEESLPVMVYVHGGGFCMQSVKSKNFDTICRDICKEHQILVFSIDYRLAPEYKFPTCLKDCYDSLKFLAARSDPGIPVNIDLGRVILTGDSAGGNLVGVLVTLWRDKVDVNLDSDESLQGLTMIATMCLHPVIFLGFRTRSHVRSKKTPLVWYPLLRWFTISYLAGDDGNVDEKMFEDRRVNLTKAPLEGLPPMIILSAEGDPFDNDVSIFEYYLQQANVSVTSQHLRKGFHAVYSASWEKAKHKEAWIFINGELTKLLQLHKPDAAMTKKQENATAPDEVNVDVFNH